MGPVGPPSSLPSPVQMIKRVGRWGRKSVARSLPRQRPWAFPHNFGRNFASGYFFAGVFSLMKDRIQVFRQIKDRFGPQTPKNVNTFASCVHRFAKRAQAVRHPCAPGSPDANLTNLPLFQGPNRQKTGLSLPCKIFFHRAGLFSNGAAALKAPPAQAKFDSFHDAKAEVGLSKRGPAPEFEGWSNPAQMEVHQLGEGNSIRDGKVRPLRHCFPNL